MNGEHWTARHGKPIIFVILTLVAVGVYLAPAPVYVTPVYVQPAAVPVYVQPAQVPVYVQPAPAPSVPPPATTPPPTK